MAINETRLLCMPLDNDLIYISKVISEKIILTQSALNDMLKYQQTKDDDTEAGGQLFAKIQDNSIIICTCTPPHSRSIRNRFRFWRSRSDEQKEIDEHYANDRHYIGDWHTHPEPVPSPSCIDNSTMKDIFLKSKHDLKYFVMIIIGNSTPPDTIWISLHDETNIIKLFLLKPD